MHSEGTLLLRRGDVASLLTLDECIAGVEAAFRQYGLGKTRPPAVLGMPSVDGGFHIKAAMLDLSCSYFAAKLNGNFFVNQQRFGMPNIQGLILLCDAANGYPLAVMDSIEITIIRTGAATAVAARYLARPDSKVVTICGCGNQGYIQLRALRRILPLERAYLFDIDERRAHACAQEFSSGLETEICIASGLGAAISKSDVCVTCTPAKQYFVHREYVSPGTFIAAVGADNHDKQELDPRLLVSATVVPDVLGNASRSVTCITQWLKVWCARTRFTPSWARSLLASARDEPRQTRLPSSTAQAQRYRMSPLPQSSTKKHSSSSKGPDFPSPRQKAS